MAIEDINNPNVKERAEFVVSEFNEQSQSHNNKKKLVLQTVVEGTIQPSRTYLSASHYGQSVGVWVILTELKGASPNTNPSS